MSKIIILPWRGEFGTMIMHYVRWANHECSKAEESIVCTRLGLGALFPNATTLYYDWDDVKDEQKNTKLLKSDDNAKYLADLAKRLSALYPGYEILTPERKHGIHKEWDFTPKPKFARGLSTDLVIAPRYRKHGEHRNFEHWDEVAMEFISRDVGVMSVGAEETSVKLAVDDVSWRYDSLDACLEMMQNCRLVLCTESGMAHLAVLAGAPLAIIYDKEGREAGKEMWPWNYPHLKMYAKNTCEPIVGGWNYPDKVINFVSKYLQQHP